MIKTYTNTTVNTSKEPFAIKSENIWYTFPKAVKECTLSDYKMWSDDSGRSMTGESKGTLVGIFPKLELKIGQQNASERAQLLKLLNKAEATVRAYSVERERFEEASFYFGDAINKLKKWDKKGTLGTRNNGIQGYTNNSKFAEISFSVISNKKRVNQ